MSGDDHIKLAATIGAFAEDELPEAIRRMAPLPVRVGPLERGGPGSGVEILLEFGKVTLLALGPNLAASALWDGLKFLLVQYRKPRGPDRPDPTVTFQVRDGDKTLEAFVTTDDPELLRTAMEGLHGVVSTALRDPENQWVHFVHDQANGWDEMQ